MLGLHDFIRHLSRNEDLIVRAYCERSIPVSAETERAISRLAAARILLSDDEGGYRLASKIRAGFDYVLDANRAFSGGGAIGPEILRLRSLVDAVNDAGREGREEALRDYEAEAIETIWSIRDMIETQIRVFDLMTRNGYHDAKTLTERLKRNEFYLGTAKELLDAVSNLNDANMREILHGTHAGGISGFFSRHILSRIESWSSTLGGLIGEMLEFMHRTKAVAETTKRIRAVLHAMRDIPAAEILDVLETAPRQFGAEAADLRPWIDVRSERNEIEIAAAAGRIDPETSLARKRTSRASGVMETDIVPEIAELSDRGPIDDLADAVLAGSDEISVRTWAIEQGLCDVMLLVMDAFDLVANDPKARFVMQTLPPKSESFTSGVRDILIRKAA